MASTADAYHRAVTKTTCILHVPCNRATTGRRSSEQRGERQVHVQVLEEYSLVDFFDAKHRNYMCMPHWQHRIKTRGVDKWLAGNRNLTDSEMAWIDEIRETVGGQ